MLFRSFPTAKALTLMFEYIFLDILFKISGFRLTLTAALKCSRPKEFAFRKSRMRVEFAFLKSRMRVLVGSVGESVKMDCSSGHPIQLTFVFVGSSAARLTRSNLVEASEADLSSGLAVLGIEMSGSSLLIICGTVYLIVFLGAICIHCKPRE